MSSCLTRPAYLHPDDQAAFDAYEAQYLKNGEPDVMCGVDMTPEKFSWQRVGHLSYYALSGDTIGELYGIVDDLIALHGPDSRIMHNETGYEIQQYIPEWTYEQRHARRRYDAMQYAAFHSATKHTKQAEEKKRLAQALKRLRQDFAK